MLNDSEDTEKIGWPIYIQYHRIIFFFTKGKSSTDNTRLLCAKCMYRKSLIAQPLFSRWISKKPLTLAISFINNFENDIRIFELDYFID